MAKPKTNKTVNSNSVEVVKSAELLTSDFASRLPYLGTARGTVKQKDGTFKLRSEAYRIHELVGNLSAIYDCMFGDRGVERTADWKPTDAQKLEAKAVKQDIADQWAKACAAGNGVSVSIFGQAGTVTRMGRERVVRDKQTGDLKARRVSLTVDTGYSTKEVLEDKVERHHREAAFIKAFAKANGMMDMVKGIK